MSRQPWLPHVATLQVADGGNGGGGAGSCGGGAGNGDGGAGDGEAMPPGASSTVKGIQM